MALLLALACGCSSAEGGPVAPGIYGDVASSEETGDLGGIELELIGSGADARVELVVCEGWCNYIHLAPVTFTHDGFTFSYDESYTDLDGTTFDAVAVSKGNAIALTISSLGPPPYSFTQDPPRIERRFGLDVAKQAGTLER